MKEYIVGDSTFYFSCLPNATITFKSCFGRVLGMFCFSTWLPVTWVCSAGETQRVHLCEVLSLIHI